MPPVSLERFAPMTEDVSSGIKEVKTARRRVGV
jgi:hypothetical protein